MKEGYLAKIEELENMRSIILTRMQLETQGYSDEEINIIMSGLTALQALSGAKWDEITRIWERCLDEAEGDVAAAIAAMQAYINSLQGKDVYVNTYYTSIYRTVYEAAGAAAPTSGTATISATAGTVGCFLSGTKISMADGSKKNIEEVKVGDAVKSWNPWRGLVKGLVVKTFKYEASSYVVINESLQVTSSHPFYTGRGLIQAEKLRIGDCLLNERGETVRVASITPIVKPLSVYNFEVNGEHNYFAEGILVHNKPHYLQTGLLNVPYPGLLAWLHPREAVLPPGEAERWRRGERSISIGPIYVGSIASDMDIRETARKLAQYVAQEERRQGLD